MNRHKQQGATAILMAVLVLGAVLVTTLTMSDIIRVNLQLERLHTDSVKSYFAAESGAEEFLWLVRKDGFNELDPAVCQSDRHIITNDAGTPPCAPPCCDSNSYPTPLGNDASYDIYYQVIGVTNNVVITGIFSDVRRKIRLLY